MGNCRLSFPRSQCTCWWTILCSSLNKVLLYWMKQNRIQFWMRKRFKSTWLKIFSLSNRLTRLTSWTGPRRLRYLFFCSFSGGRSKKVNKITSMQNACFADVGWLWTKLNSSIKTNNRNRILFQSNKVFRLFQNTGTFACGWMQNVRILKDTRFIFSTFLTRSRSQSRCFRNVRLRRQKKFVWSWTSTCNLSSRKRQTSLTKSGLCLMSVRVWETQWIKKRWTRNKASGECSKRGRRGWRSLWATFWGRKWEDR